jgi:hypothetical protein
MLRGILIAGAMLAGFVLPAGAATVTGDAIEPTKDQACQRARAKADGQARGLCKYRGGVHRIKGGNCQTKDFSKVYSKRMFKGIVCYDVQCLRRG